MATIIREAMATDQASVTLFVGGSSKVGFGLSGTWQGSVTFLGTTDGVRFDPISVVPFPNGAPISLVTANGNFEYTTQNLVAARVLFSHGSGTLIAALAAARDASYQDAFLAATSKYLSQKQTGGTQNVVTQPGQSNRAWRLKSLSVAFSAAPAAAVDVSISDGASSILWEGYVPKTDSGGVGMTWRAPLPDPESGDPGNADGGVVGTPGNSMVVTLAAPSGGVTSILNCEFQCA